MHTHPRRLSVDADAVAMMSYSNGTPVGLSADAQTIASAATYHPAMMLASWTAGNGIATNIDQDTSSLPRPGRIRTGAIFASKQSG
jgi:hypothetical protein